MFAEFKCRMVALYRTPTWLHIMNYLDRLFVSRMTWFQYFYCSLNEEIMSLPTFVCVPGSSHQPRIFDRIKYTLALHGYTVLPIALPSNGARPAIYDFTEDVRAIREQVAMLVNTGEDVIVVLHGYAGVPGSEALWGLGKAERAQRGFRGGVLRIVFIMSILAKEGFQASERGDISFMYPWTQCDLEVCSFNH